MSTQTFAGSPPLSSMQAVVFTLSHQPQVFWSVISSVMVDVVRDFMAEQMPPKCELQNKRVFAYVAAPIGSGVARGIEKQVPVMPVGLSLAAPIMPVNERDRLASVPSSRCNRPGGNGRRLAAAALASGPIECGNGDAPVVALDEPLAPGTISDLRQFKGRATPAFAELSGRLIKHLKLILSGVTPRAVTSSAEAFSCPNFTAFQRN